MGEGDVVAMARRVDGYGRGNGVVSGLHEVCGAQQRLARAAQGLKKLLCAFHTT